MKRLLMGAILAAVMLVPAGAQAQAPTPTDVPGAQAATADFVAHNLGRLIDVQGRASVDAAADTACVQQTSALRPRFFCVFGVDISDRVRLRVPVRSHYRGGPHPPKPTQQPRRVLVRHFHCIGVVRVQASFFRPSVSLIASDCVRGRNTVETLPAPVAPTDDDS